MGMGWIVLWRFSGLIRVWAARVDEWDGVAGEAIEAIEVCALLEFVNSVRCVVLGCCDCASRCRIVMLRLCYDWMNTINIYVNYTLLPPLQDASLHAMRPNHLAQPQDVI